MNTQLVSFLVKIINSLTLEERQLLEKKLCLNDSEPSTQDMMKLAEKGGSFDFLHDEPDLYTLEDGEAV